MEKTVESTISLIEPATRLGQVKEYYFSRKLREIASMRAMGKDVLNLGIGSPDLPPHKSVVETLHTASALTGNHAYQSYQGLPALREAFAGWYKKFFQVELNAENEVLPLIGSKEGIMHISMSFLNPGDEVLVPNPGYPSYRSATELAGGVIRSYELNEASDWFPDLKSLEQEDISKVKIMWVNYPHMPTGTPARFAFFQELLAFAQRNKILIVNDNPYAFILTDEPMSIFSVPGAKNVALELNSLSKSHNMAGWRVGMVAGASDYIKTILRFKSNMDSGMFKPLQLAAKTALELPASWYEDQNEIYQKRRRLAEQLLQILGCRVLPDQVGMFVWARVGEQYTDGYQLADQVLDNQNVFITPGGIFGSAGESYVRVSLCSSLEKLEQAINRIK